MNMDDIFSQFGDIFEAVWWFGGGGGGRAGSNLRIKVKLTLKKLPMVLRKSKSKT
jgi:hypothetical protein